MALALSLVTWFKVASQLAGQSKNQRDSQTEQIHFNATESFVKGVFVGKIADCSERFLTESPDVELDYLRLFENPIFFGKKSVFRSNMNYSWKRKSKKIAEKLKKVNH